MAAWAVGPSVLELSLQDSITRLRLVRVLKMMSADPINQSAGKQHLALTRRQRVTREDVAVRIQSLHDYGLSTPQLVRKVLDPDAITTCQRFVISWIGKCQRKNAEIHQVLPVDASKALSQNDS